MLMVFLFPVFLMLIFSMCFLLTGWFAGGLSGARIFHAISPFVFLMSLAGLFLYLLLTGALVPERAFLLTNRPPPLEVAAYLIPVMAVPIGWLQFRLEGWAVERMRRSRGSAMAQNSHDGRMSLMLVLPLAVVLEELIWRGYLMDSMTDQANMPLPMAVLLSSFAFGLHHAAFGWVHIFFKAGHGLVWAVMALCSGSLFAPIIAHCLFNYFALSSRKKSYDNSSGDSHSSFSAISRMRWRKDRHV
ncbi:MAG: hypothetical protein Tsb008_06950 [Rhodothalassiaceae bacterium]